MSKGFNLMRSIYCFAGVLLAGCSQHGGVLEPKDSVVLVPMDRTAILPVAEAPPLMATSYHLPDGIDGSWQLEPKDLVGVENLLQDTMIQRYPRMAPFITPDYWKRMMRQAVGVTKGGKKFIFLEYFSAQFAQMSAGLSGINDSWKHRPVVVSDGGISIFRILYDCEAGRIVWFESNGVA